MATAIEILDTIRDNASTAYQNAVPSALNSNLEEIGKVITSDAILANEFIGALINKVGMQNIKTLDFESPFHRLYGENIPYGGNIEDIYINPACDQGFDHDGTKLLKTTTPDGKSAYYGLNRQSQFAQSITAPELARAFTSEAKFNQMYNTIISTLKSGDEYQEFLLGKKLLGMVIDNGLTQVLESDISTSANVKELRKAISNIAKSFTFVNSNYCGYNKVNADAITAGEKPCLISCKKKNQVLFLRADVETEFNFEVLANMFNIPEEEMREMTIVVDDIPSTKYDVYAVLADKASFRFNDAVYESNGEYIKSNLTFNYWLHHWQYINFSMFTNCVAFGKSKTA